VFVADGQPSDPQPRVYHTWQDPPILLAIEIGSRSTFRVDEGPKQEIYEQLIRARAYLYANPPVGDLRLWQRGGPGRYETVVPEANGRVRLADLGLEFGIEAGHLRIYTLEGARLRTHDESEALLTVVAQQRQEAEERAAAEARQREEAEERAREAEERAAAEQKQRAELERQLAALRARFQRDGGREDARDP
jgi:phage-related minor tail protein